MRAGWIIGIGVLILIIGGILLVPINIQEIYDDTEYYTEKEPYEVQVPYTETEPYAKLETYYEKEPYTEEECTTKNYAYNIKNIECRGRALFSDAQVEYEVNNLEKEGGTFAVWVGFILSDGNEIGKETSKYIQPQSSATFSYSADADITYCSKKVNEIPTYQDCQTVTKYRDVAKTREVTNYQEVTKHRTVTKYRDVQKSRTVLKTKTVQKPIYQILAEKLGL